MTFNIKTSTSLMLLFGVVLFSCKKQDITTPADQAHFANQTIGTYFITNSPTTSYKIPIGLTTVSDRDRTVTVTVASRTGAVAGTHYSLPSTSVTIPAGKSLDSLTVRGIFGAYNSQRLDTLVFRITGGDVPKSTYNDSFQLVLRKYCDVNLSTFLGTYTNSFDNVTYGPYNMRVDSAVTTSATTGYLKIRNLWDTGDPALIRVDLDWSDPANFKTTVVNAQFLYTDLTYGTARVRPIGTGTFSSCENTFTFKYQVYVAAGSFAATTTAMAR